jgi:hypothetical protein
MSQENYVFVPSTSPELKNIADCAVSNLIPEKSKRQYDKCYNDFKERCNKNNVKTVSENVVLAYLMEKSKTVKSSTLWSTYSMLKLTLNIRDGIGVTKFLKLVPFLKKSQLVIRRKSLRYWHETRSICCIICPFLGHFNHGNIRSHAKRRTNQNVYRWHQGWTFCINSGRSWHKNWRKTNFYCHQSRICKIIPQICSSCSLYLSRVKKIL